MKEQLLAELKERLEQERLERCVNQETFISESFKKGFNSHVIE